MTTTMVIDEENINTKKNKQKTRVGPIKPIEFMHFQFSGLVSSPKREKWKNKRHKRGGKFKAIKSP